MAACSQCGHPNVTGKFCGSCGAPVAAQPQTPPQAQTPIPPVAPTVPPVAPPAYPQPGQPPMTQQQPPYRPAPKRSNGLLIALGVVAGVIVLGFVGLMVLGSLIDDPVPAAGPGPQDQGQGQGQTTPNQGLPPTQPVPGEKPADPNPLGVQWAQKEAAGVKLVSKGQIAEPFVRIQWFYDGLVLGRKDSAGNTEAMTMYYDAGQFKPSMQYTAPLGGDILQVTTGDLLNAGAPQALVLSSKGMIMIDEAEEWEQFPTEGINNLLVADWDGDGLHEMAAFFANQNKGRLRRYTAAEGWVELGEFPRETLPANGVVTRLTMDKRRLLLGEVRGAQGTDLNLGLYTLDATKGFEPAMTFKVAKLQTPTGLAAGVLNGKATIVVAHAGAPSYLALYEITNQGAEPLGVVNLPDNGQYQVLIGPFSDPNANQILTIDPKGRWQLHGF